MIGGKAAQTANRPKRLGTLDRGGDNGGFRDVHGDMIHHFTTTQLHRLEFETWHSRTPSPKTWRS